MNPKKFGFGAVLAQLIRCEGVVKKRCFGVFAPLSSLAFGRGAVNRKVRNHQLTD